jgi:His/Glu/Gln/Arg/opine family amino acid ABC transporter permease subunit
MAYQWDWSALWDNLTILLSGIQTTVLAALVSMIGALALGLPVALLRLSRWRFAWIAYLYIELFRNLPLLVLVLWVFIALPLITGIALDPFTCGVLALTLNLAAFVAEIYRAGITSIGGGQTHAALALGMTRPQLFRRIILPQAVARVLPALGSVWVSLFKDTSILSVIGVAELMYEGRLVATDTYRPLEVFTGVAVIYYILAYPQALGVNWVFERFRVRE